MATNGRINRTQLEFQYLNYHGRNHVYLIEVEGMDFKLGVRTESAIEDAWYINGNVVTRDGDTRPEMGPTRRRSFRLDRMHSIREVKITRSNDDV